MKLISHRGNTQGPNPYNENRPSYIEFMLKKYDCEVDVRNVSGQWYLGHDASKYQVDLTWLKKPGLWLHCKNMEAFAILAKEPHNFNAFFHQNDDYTLTTQGWIWCYPGKPGLQATKNMIAVLPDGHGSLNLNDFAGICSDYIDKWSKR